MKRFWLSYFLTVVSVTMLLCIVVYLFDPLQFKQSSVVVPIPSFLSQLSNKQVTTLTLWQPVSDYLDSLPASSLGGSSKKPPLTAKSALVYDLTDNKVLFEKNPKEKVPMASLTKIMTAIIALEKPRIDNTYIVPEEALVGEDTMGLTASEKLTLQELLYGLMLHSGNDAAEVLAIDSPYGREGFVKAMNDKANALGLKDTHFTNPTGLEGDGDQYTTAYDLLVITRYALDNYPMFASTAKTFDVDLPYSANHKEFYLENETNLLTSYPGVQGVKTGYTPEAGLCLVTYLNYKGHKIIGVLLGSENRRAEMANLLDYSLNSLGIKPPSHI